MRKGDEVYLTGNLGRGGGGRIQISVGNYLISVEHVIYAKS